MGIREFSEWRELQIKILGEIEANFALLRRHFFRFRFCRVLSGARLEWPYLQF